MNYVRRKDIESIETESVWLEIIVKNSKPFLLCSFYRPHSSNADWFEYFSKEIDHAQTISDEIYIAGDMTVDCKHGILSHPKWKHLVELYDLQQVINCPARITAHSETLIDHLYVSNINKLSDISVPSIAISDHYPICFTRTSTKHSVKRQQHKTIQYRCYKKFSEQSFLNELSTALDQLVISDSDTNSNFENLNTIILKVLNNHAPLKNKRVKKETQPEWFNDDIKAAIKQRDFNHKLKNWNQYKHWRNKTNSLIQNAKRDFFSNSIAENKDCSYLWKHIKNLDNKFTASKLPDELIIDEEKINDPTVIIENLNCFFSTISEKLKSQQTETGPEFDWGKFKSHVESKVPESVQFQIPLMTLENLITSIRSLDPSEATGLDGITPKIVKLSAEVISPTLLRIINTSISSGNFPETLKIAKILPIHKGGAKNDPSNYRPISILSVISKLVEKHVTKHLFGFLNKYDLLHKSQSGFRKHHSCNTALLNLLDKWLKSINKGELVGAIFFDLRKAFDVVDHELLLKKLSVYKFSNTSLNWIKSYVSNRKQCVIDHKIRSSMQNIQAGVPHNIT